jgi:hypothetical protein
MDPARYCPIGRCLELLLDRTALPTMTIVISSSFGSGARCAGNGVRG